MKYTSQPPMAAPIPLFPSRLFRSLHCGSELLNVSHTSRILIPRDRAGIYQLSSYPSRQSGSLSASWPQRTCVRTGISSFQIHSPRSPSRYSRALHLQSCPLEMLVGLSIFPVPRQDLPVLMVEVIVMLARVALRRILSEAEHFCQFVRSRSCCLGWQGLHLLMRREMSWWSAGT